MMMTPERQQRIRKLRKEFEEQFNSDLVFLLKSANIFALMSYDIVQETKKAVDEYNKKANENYILSNKFRRSAKKMNEHREQMAHFALTLTKELSDVLGEHEDDEENKIKPLSLFQEVCDTYERFAELLGAILLQSNEQVDYLKELWGKLRSEVKSNFVQIDEPNWEELESLTNTARNITEETKNEKSLI